MLRVLELPQLSAKISGNRAHTVYTRLGFGGAVVICIGIHVVGVDCAVAIGDELDTGDADAVIVDKQPIALDDRMVKIFDDVEAWHWQGRWARLRVLLADWAECIAHLADIGGTKLEPQ